jgi:hypothetical protein
MVYAPRHRADRARTIMTGGIALRAKGRSVLVGLVGATALAGCNLLFGVDDRSVLQLAEQGSVICGSQLNAQTQLRIGVGNTFPNMGSCPEPPLLGCGGGIDVGSDSANQFVIASCG